MELLEEVSGRFQRERTGPPGCLRWWWEDHGPSASSWMYVEGELDVATSPELRRALRRPRGSAPLVVVDLRRVVFMDVSGARVIASASARATRAGNSLVVIRPLRGIEALFSLPGVADAVESFHLNPAEPMERVLQQRNATRR